MDLMEWALWSLGYLRDARNSIHDDFNDLMKEISAYRGAGGQEWFSTAKNIIQTLYHYSSEFAEELTIPSANNPSPEAFSERLDQYRNFVLAMLADLREVDATYIANNNVTGAPFLVEEAQRKVVYVLNAIDYVLSKRPNSLQPEQATTAVTNNVDRAKDHIVLVIHGIRDRGSWQRMVQDVLEAGTSVRVMPISYGYFDVLRFLVPGPPREGPVRFVQRELATALSRFSGKRVSVIAHSYGTAAITKVLERDRTMNIHHLVLCGAIVPRSYDWGATRKQVHGSIVNDYGVKDPWPVVATSVTWGFGMAGAYGFKSTAIDRDRDHNFGHSGFMERPFVERYWKPLFATNEIVPVDRSTGYGGTPWYFRLLGFPWKYFLLVALIWIGFRLF